jgi:hypothetical protein
MTFLTLRIRKHERGLLFRFGDFARVLRPGEYRLWSRLWSRSRAAVEVVSTLQTQFTHALLPVLLNDQSLRSELEVIDLTDTQRALLWRDGRLYGIFGPGRYAFWKTPFALTIEVAM